MIKGTIKTIDKAAVAGQRMKQAYITTKDKAEHSVYALESSAEEYASNKIEQGTDAVVHEGVHQAGNVGRWSVRETKENVRKAKDGIERFKTKRAEESLKKQSVYPARTQTAEVTKQSERPIKQSVKSTGKEAVKSTAKGTVKTAEKSVKTAEQTAKATIKTSQQAAKTAQTSVKATQKAVQTAKVTAKATVQTIKTAVKAIIEGTKALVAAISAGGWIAVVIIIVLCLFGALCASFYGIFFSNEASETGLTIQSVIQEINSEYDDKIEEIKSNNTYDEYEITGTKSNWKDVLAIYSVKVAADDANPLETATIDNNKKSILKDIFWDMNAVSSNIDTTTETKEVQTTDESGNTVTTTEEVQKKILTITLNSKTADDMALVYGFDDVKKGYLTELMSSSNDELWASLIYNIGTNSSNIDIYSLTFESEEANDTQKKLVAVATNSEYYGISARSGYCQAWVADVYQAVTGSRGSAHCALCAADMWAVSSNWSEIQIGATVYGYASNPYGHVGIYIGNGQVIHNLSGEIVVQSLESWVEQFNSFSWGWENGEILMQ